MRILVVGAGAVGSFLAWVLARAGEDVVLLRRGAGAPSPADLVVVGPSGASRHARVTVAGVADDVRDDDAVDVAIVAVKQYDVPAALEELAALPATAVVTTQNGIGAEEAAADARPGGVVIAASLTASVERDADDRVRWLRRGGLGLAPFVGDARTVAERLAVAFRAGSLSTDLLADARAMKWSKLLANLVANATSGLLDLDSTTIYAHPGLFDVERAQLREALAVMRAIALRPVDIPGARVQLLALATALPTPLARLALRRVVGSARGGKDPSLRGAVEAGGRTEIAWLNGAVAREATRLGVPAPVNARLAALVDEASTDPARRDWFRGRPDLLLEAIGRVR